MLSVLAPLLIIQGDKKVTIGVVLIRIEPYQFLYPLQIMANSESDWGDRIGSSGRQ